MPKDLLDAAEHARFAVGKLYPATARARREADDLFDQMVRWSKHQTSPARRSERTIVSATCSRETSARLRVLSAATDATLTIYDKCTSADRTMQIGLVDLPASPVAIDEAH